MCSPVYSRGFASASVGRSTTAAGRASPTADALPRHAPRPPAATTSAATPTTAQRARAVVIGAPPRAPAYQIERRRGISPRPGPPGPSPWLLELHILSRDC
uniref:Uncharacterized protein n=1 Tax=Tolypothrix bouteillei VB521301 TaxID=1479485 RepID=A0A0C1MWG8_9CYAN